MTLLWMLAAIAAALAAISVALILVGRRGRRIDDHPVCRRCGFDLVGHSPRPPLCPECGASLAPPRAVRMGARRRRNGPYFAGLAIAGLVVIGVGFGALNFKRINTPANKPVWLLFIEARAQDEAVVNRALTEINRRGQADALSEAQLDRYKPIIVDLQTSPDRPWSYPHVAALMWLFETDRINDDDYNRMAEFAAMAEPEARAAVRVGDEWHIRRPLHARSGRTTAGWQPRWHASDAEICWIGLPADAQPGFEHSGYGLIRAQTPMEPGEYEVEVRYTAFLTTPQASDTVVRPPSAPWTETHRLRVTILPEGTEDIRKVTGPEIDAQVRESIQTPRIKLSTRNGALIMLFELPVEDPPVAMGLTGEIRQGDRRWPLMNYAAVERRSTKINFSRVVEGMEAAPVTVVIRGSEEVARSFPAMTETWVGEIVFENVLPEVGPATN